MTDKDFYISEFKYILKRRLKICNMETISRFQFLKLVAETAVSYKYVHKDISDWVTKE